MKRKKIMAEEEKQKYFEEEITITMKKGRNLRKKEKI